MTRSTDAWVGCDYSSKLLSKSDDVVIFLICLASRAVEPNFGRYCSSTVAALKTNGYFHFLVLRYCSALVWTWQ